MMVQTRFIFLLSTLTSCLGTTTPLKEERRRNMLGGYHTVDTASIPVLNAADFAVTELLARKTVTPTEPYSFTAKLSGDKEMNANDLRVDIIGASEQVVAGLNYKLSIALSDRDTHECFGAFVCTVYDHFGDLSVTDFGAEVSCDVAMNELKSRQKEREMPDDLEPDT